MKSNALIREVHAKHRFRSECGGAVPTQNENAAMPTPRRANGGGFIRHGAARSCFSFQYQGDCN